jgi:uncharacterized protein (DUF58 family)
VRHLDWRAFARSDQLVVRLYREEILPRLDLVVDASRSMGLHADKAQAAVDLATLIAWSARADGLAVNVVLCSDPPEPVPLDRLGTRGSSSPAARRSTRASWASARSCAQARCASCSPTSSSHTIRARSRACWWPHGSGLALIQLLAREERTPTLESALRLTDCEDEKTLDLVVDRATTTRYRQRLEQLTQGLDEECRRLGARFASLTSGPALDELCRDALVPAQILAPAVRLTDGAGVRSRRAEARPLPERASARNRCPAPWDRRSGRASRSPPAA